MKLLDPKGAAERLNVGRGQVYDLIHSGILPTVKIPGRRSYRIDPADVDRLIKEWNSGSIRGSEDETEPVQVEENAALLKRSRTAPKKGGKVLKWQWAERHARKANRG